MKTRLGFVSNSSSSSFLIATKDKSTIKVLELLSRNVAKFGDETSIELDGITDFEQIRKHLMSYWPEMQESEEEYVQKEYEAHIQFYRIYKDELGKETRSREQMLSDFRDFYKKSKLDYEKAIALIQKSLNQKMSIWGGEISYSDEKYLDWEDTEITKIIMKY